MSPRATFWLIIVVLAIGTWAMRSLPIMLHGRIRLPEWTERLLRHVPVAALTALVVPGALYLKDNGHYEFAPERLLAAVVALLVAARTRSVVATLGAGMTTLWLVGWVLRTMS
ncbi:MAG: AzlD domain-containing protein [Actinomycetota bacterium]|nr:AzlD domain-containing protein [Actinomycetota bacterium]MDZ4179607.1 AzlD domain-containing protein [Coriobacteriia bacterium]